MPTSYRAILTEMLTAQAAAVSAFVDVSARCIQLVGQECEATLAEENERGGTSAGLAAQSPANFCRAIAGLPRFSLMSFLSHYDDLRGRRPPVGD